MKTFLTYLLASFALALCALCAFQWVREARLRAETVRLNDVVFDKSKTIQALEGTVKRTETEVERLDKLKTELIDTVKSNRQEILIVSKLAEKLERESEAQKTQIEVYKGAVERANDSIKKQNEDIKRQNEEMKKLAEERNTNVVKFNKLVEQYNELVKQYNKLQEDAAKAAAAPAK
jgi:chromosome segregation ATPase